MAFKGFLKQATAATLKLGPFVDSTDGNTEETALTISQADVRLSKNGGNMAQKNESTSCTHDEIGIYDCPVDATDTDTCGRLMVAVHESGSLLVQDEYQVVEENVYDAIFAASAALGTDVAAILVDTGTTLQAEVDGIQADTEDIQSRLPAALVSGRIDASVGAMAANVMTAAAAAADLGTELATAVWASATRTLSALGFTLGAGDLANDTITAAKVHSDVSAEIWASATRTLTAIDEDSTTLDLDATIRAAVGLAAADLDTQLDTLASAIDAVDNFVDDLESRLSAALATALQAHGLAIGRLVVGAGSTTTAIVFGTVNGGAPSAVNDFYNGRTIIFTSGALTLQAVEITDYVGATVTATVSAATGAPAESVTAVIV